MAQIAAPYGFRIIKMVGDLPFSGGIHTIPLITNSAAGFFFGDPVGLSAGNPTVLTATPTSTLSANSPVGIFMGAEWIDPVRGFVNAQYLPGGAIANGATRVKLKIADAPDLIMQIQANGSIPATSIGFNAGLIITPGNVATGNSTIALDASSTPPGGAGTAATLALKIYDFVYNAAPSPGASSLPGDPYTDVLVQWNMSIHRYNLGGGI